MTLAFCSGPSSLIVKAPQCNGGTRLVHHVALQQPLLGPLHTATSYAVPNSLLNISSRTRINSRITMAMSSPSPSSSPSSSDESRNNNSNENYEFDDDLDQDLFDEDDDLLELLDLEELERFGDSLQDYELDELQELEEMMEQQGWKVSIDRDEDEPSAWKADFIKQSIPQTTRILSHDSSTTKISMSNKSESLSPSALEQALLQGVVPASAGVGSSCLPGDFGFDPLGLATKDYFKKVQNFMLGLLPESKSKSNDDHVSIESGAALPLGEDFEDRPAALILRDYREIEIRHGRLAMLATILWPLQEITDRLFIPDSFGDTTMVYGGTTLPFVSLFMTLVLLLLGYLDIYAASIKDSDVGDAFLPGECFWDPLCILDGAPDAMKRNMQARELNNGRMAMIAVLSYILQEGITHQPLITLPWNQVLFEPAFEIPAVQAWLDGQFAGASKTVDQGITEEIWRELLDAASDTNVAN
mmetsp:Transcript_14106/g.21148  ORF Transcript_14106/g.21148 Transcript_14106/m.21148 type:complete len:473 (-) Transcript_14106:2-1420(-)